MRGRATLSTTSQIPKQSSAYISHPSLLSKLYPPHEWPVDYSSNGTHGESTNYPSTSVPLPFLTTQRRSMLNNNLWKIATYLLYSQRFLSNRAFRQTMGLYCQPWAHSIDTTSTSEIHEKGGPFKISFHDVVRIIGRRRGGARGVGSHELRCTSTF